MPKKKAKSKKGKGKKGKSKSKETKASDAPKDPMTPAYIPPPPLPRDRVINLVIFKLIFFNNNLLEFLTQSRILRNEAMGESLKITKNNHLEMITNKDLQIYSE